MRARPTIQDTPEGVDTPHGEAALYQREHPKYGGKFAILRLAGGGPGGRSIADQEMHDVADLLPVVAEYAGRPDTYISQATFRSPRRWVVNVGRICLNFVDLDTYRSPALDGLPPEAVAGRVVLALAAEGVPPPSVVLFTGRGLVVKWLTSGPLPLAALPRWNEVQHTLCRALEPFGADASARDAARVLRLVGTLNSRSRERVRVVHVTPDPAGAPVAYQWDALADAVLPVERKIVEEARRRRAPVQLSLLPGDGELSHDATKNFRRLAWARWMDISTLIDLRGGIAEGQRMTFLMWATNFLLASGHMTASQMWGEAVEVARRIDPQWSARKAELGTLYRKALQQAEGKMTQFNGRLYPPLYTPRNSTLIEQLRITSDEMAHMRTILDSERQAAKRLDGWREKDEKRRRAEGQQTRADYLEAATKTNPAEVRRLAAQGLSQRQIAMQCNVSRTRVQQILRGG